jgi:hypothetical protein
LLAFQRRNDGKVEPVPTSNETQKTRAQNLISLYCLDEPYTKAGDRDERWLAWAEAFRCAVACKIEHSEGKISMGAILREAKNTGFFSVWFQVFADIPEIKKALVEAPFFHLSPAFFDTDYNPIPRITGDL